MSLLSELLITETTHIANGYIPPPWVELAFIDANTTELFNIINEKKSLRQRMHNIPWSEYKKMLHKVESLFKNIVNISSKSWDLKPKCEDVKNNIFSANVEIKNLRALLEATTLQLNNYGDNLKTVEIKKVLREADSILKYLRGIDFSPKLKECQKINDDSKKYIGESKSHLDATKHFDYLKHNVTKYFKKIDDLNLKIDETMNNLFEYDNLFRAINKNYSIIKNQNDNTIIIDKDITELIDEGSKLNEEAKGFIVDSQNNFQVIQYFIFLFFLSDLSIKLFIFLFLRTFLN